MLNALRKTKPDTSNMGPQKDTPMASAGREEVQRTVVGDITEALPIAHGANRELA
jgi:hypothetical protein